MASDDSKPAPPSLSNGMPSLSQKGRSMKAIPRQQATQSAPGSATAARQTRQDGG